MDPKSDAKTPGPETDECEHAPSRYLSAKANRLADSSLSEAEIAAAIEAAEDEALSWSRLANRC